MTPGGSMRLESPLIKSPLIKNHLADSTARDGTSEEDEEDSLSDPVGLSKTKIKINPYTIISH
jgi:hypothetical protein